MIVHDMRSPLTGIMYGLDLAIDQVCDGDRELMKMSRASAQHLNNMITTLLDVSRLEEGRMPVKIEPHSIDILVQNVFDTFAGVVFEKKLSFRKPAYPVTVNCDSELTERVITNLLSNAVKFTPSGGVILGMIEVTADSVSLHITNTGPGIPDDVRGHIFEKFAQADSTRTQNSSGLGLNFCKLAMEAQGGTIGFESEDEAGTTFFITFPEPV